MYYESRAILMVYEAIKIEVNKKEVIPKKGIKIEIEFYLIIVSFLIVADYIIGFCKRKTKEVK